MKIYRDEYIRNEKSGCNGKGDTCNCLQILKARQSVKRRDLFYLVTLERFFRARFKKSA